MTERRLISLLKDLFSRVSKGRRIEFAFLVALTLLSSFAEVLSLVLIVPFIAVLTGTSGGSMQETSWVMGLLGHPTGTALVMRVTLAFALAALIAGALRLRLLYRTIALANATGIDLSIEAYRRTLYQPYSVHVGRNSSEIISGITQKVSTATAVFISIGAVVTSASLLIAIVVTLITIDPFIATVAMGAFGVGYGLIAWITRSRLVRNSRCIAEEQTTVVKALQEGLGGIREVLLDGTQALYSDLYARAITQLSRANGENTFINQAPRFAMETLAMLLLAVLAIFITGQGAEAVTAALPVVGALGLGAQRLLPLLQQLYGNWSVVTGNQAAIADMLELLDQPMPDYASEPPPAAMTVRKSVAFDNVSFRYDAAGPWVLHQASLSVAKGSRVGFVGSSGSGKSTAFDLLMALLDPTSGAIRVDGVPVTPESRRAWQATVAHVPQSIYLADATIAENIAFSVAPGCIDMARVRQVARQAQLADFIEGRPQGYETYVGERGVRLSGGQRQRIAIARALYKQASVLVFDEATSALDSATEAAVMDAIESLSRDLTILIAAHRISTLRRCDVVVRVEQGLFVVNAVPATLPSPS